ncbi:twin-arginine translocase subunit TatC [Candidatus Latescibacterota bacterium]
MDDLDPYSDYTGYDPEHMEGTETSSANSEADTVTDEALIPLVASAIDSRRCEVVDTGVSDNSSYTVTSGSGSNGYTLTAVISEPGRVSLHPLGIAERPAGVSMSYWSSLDEDNLLTSTTEIDSHAIATVLPGEEVAVSEGGAEPPLPVTGSDVDSGGDDGDADVEGPDSTEMPFLDHLEEFRWALLKSIFTLAISMVGCWFIAKYFMVTITRLAKGAELDLIYTKLMEPIMIQLQIALYLGLVLSLPFVFYFLWSFIAPGLYKREKKWILPLVYVATISFLIGASIAYFIIIPFVLQLVKRFMNPDILAMLTIGDFISKVLKFTILFGVIFEMPLVSYILAKIGIIKHSWMSKYRKYAIVCIFIVGAIFTPPDPISQIMLALPLILLYEISIISARIAGSKTLL